MHPSGPIRRFRHAQAFMSFRESRIEVLWERLVRATFDRLTRHWSIDIREGNCLARTSRWRIEGPYQRLIVRSTDTVCRASVIKQFQAKDVDAVDRGFRVVGQLLWIVGRARRFGTTSSAEQGAVSFDRWRSRWILPKDRPTRPKRQTRPLRKTASRQPWSDRSLARLSSGGPSASP